MHMHQTSPVSLIYAPAIPACDILPSAPSSPVFRPSPRPPSSSRLEISEKIAEGQIRGWLPLCVTSKDKYSQDDSQCPEDVYVCTCCSSPHLPTHTDAHMQAHVWAHRVPPSHTLVLLPVAWMWKSASIVRWAREPGSPPMPSTVLRVFTTAQGLAEHESICYSQL